MKQISLLILLLGCMFTSYSQVGIGTTSPTGMLEVTRSGGSSNQVIVQSNYGNPNEFWMRRAQGTLASPTAIGANGVLGRIVGMGYYGSGFNNSASLHFESETTPTLTSSPGNIVFSVTPSGSISLAEKFRINSSGAWGLNGANYGTAGQYLMTNGSTGTPTWSNLGQSVTTVYGSSQLSVMTSTTAFTLIPGLTTTFTLASNSLVYIATDGGMYTNSTTTNSSTNDIAIKVDGSLMTNGGYARITSTNPGSYSVGNYSTRWGISTVVPLSAGSHTITVNAAYIAGVSSQVSGSNTTVTQGELTTIIIKQ